MLIVNSTQTSIFTDRGVEIKSKESLNYRECIFDTLNLHSNIGSAIITCEYKHKQVKTYGCIGIIVSEETNALTIIEQM